MHIKIKICGITRYEDAKAATHLGADALGFIFYPKSPRYITPANAAEIISKLPPFVTKVGVFVNESHEHISEVVRISGIDTLQLHGSESPEFCLACQKPVIKVFSISSPQDLGPLGDYSVSGLLLDTWDKSLKGGSGKTFDWSIAEQATRAYPHVILAGGLGPINIREALTTVIPYAVDVNSGVEIMPGVKNPQKMREVIEIVRNWRYEKTGIA